MKKVRITLRNCRNAVPQGFFCTCLAVLCDLLIMENAESLILCGFQRLEKRMKRQFHRKIKIQKETEKYVLSDRVNMKYEKVME